MSITNRKFTVTINIASHSDFMLPSDRDVRSNIISKLQKEHPGMSIEVSVDHEDTKFGKER